ncbi:MAG: FaeA/PapI family transcriptional regulator [Candidatus Hadarchaeum sp.]|uniref:FaeA/PapI family transcriptional regulator n=1 Tax=Candidatus Hadarchaeum sp. TaxID=2883567 RepID=UPI003180F9A5
MKRDLILKALKEAGTPVTTEELARMTGIDIVRLRVDLYHLTEEGKVERRLRGNTPVWTIKLGMFPEQR